jgi:hypothetical protein
LSIYPYVSDASLSHCRGLSNRDRDRRSAHQAFGTPARTDHLLDPNVSLA